MTTRFRTRTFLLCFVPFAALLACSFWMIQHLVQSTVRGALRTSMRENQTAIANIHAKGDLQNSRFLKVAGENPALKAGMELILANAGSQGARRTVEDQLRELGEHMGFDFLLVSAPNGTPLAGVLRSGGDGKGQHGQLEPLSTGGLGRVRSGFLQLGGRTFQVASVPLDQSDENLGTLSVGEYFDFSEFTTAAVLVQGGKVVETNIRALPMSELDAALAGCGVETECEVRLRGVNWISIALPSHGEGFQLRSLENVDRVTGPIQSKLNRVFLTLALICVLVALVCSMASSRSIEKPIGTMVTHLRNAVRTGVLPALEVNPSSILEIRELANIYNRAAVSVRAAGEELESAYLEFVGSLANALDARDQYTSGHSHRVSQLSCATAAAMQLEAADVERIRIGALLHDIGKIGIADSVLQKPGKLTQEEFALVKQHPVIGRRILEGVHGFAQFLPAVELHHENWDGTGYPKRQAGEETPIEARIIHVADAYDAMTTDRSYRHGMTHERAIAILIEFAGIQFDPKIVDVFINLPREILTSESAELEPAVAVAVSVAVEEPELAVAV